MNSFRCFHQQSVQLFNPALSCGWCEPRPLRSCIVFLWSSNVQSPRVAGCTGPSPLQRSATTVAGSLKVVDRWLQRGAAPALHSFLHPTSILPPVRGFSRRQGRTTARSMTRGSGVEVGTARAGTREPCALRERRVGLRGPCVFQSTLLLPHMSCFSGPRFRRAAPVDSVRRCLCSCLCAVGRCCCCVSLHPKPLERHVAQSVWHDPFPGQASREQKNLPWFFLFVFLNA